VASTPAVFRDLGTLVIMLPMPDWTFGIGPDRVQAVGSGPGPLEWRR
jgi:hypothetical protein